MKNVNYLRNAFLYLAFLLVAAFVAKLGWDEYQIRRARNHVPGVRVIFDQTKQVPRAVTDKSVSTSVNEYSVALWQHYKSDASCGDIQHHFSSEATRQGFEHFPNGTSDNVRTAEYAKGELGMRVLCEADGYAFSVNWSGS